MTRKRKNVKAKAKVKVKKPSSTAARSLASHTVMRRVADHARPAMVRSRPDGSAVISGCELVGQVSAVSGTAQGNRLFRISLGLDDDPAALYPTLRNVNLGDGTRVAGLAQFWEKFRVRKLVVHYKTVTSALTGGGLIAAADVDVRDSATFESASTSQLSAHLYSQTFAAWEDTSIRIPVDPDFHYFVDSEESAENEGSTNRFMSAGLFSITATGTFTDIAVLGLVFLEYEFDFMCPTFESPGEGDGGLVLRLTADTTSAAASLPVDPLLTTDWVQEFTTKKVPDWWDPVTKTVAKAGDYLYDISTAQPMTSSSFTPSPFQVNNTSSYSSTLGSAFDTLVFGPSAAQYGGIINQLWVKLAQGDTLPGFINSSGTTLKRAGTSVVVTPYDVPLSAYDSKAKAGISTELTNRYFLIRRWARMFPLLSSEATFFCMVRDGVTEIVWDSLAEQLHRDICSGSPQAHLVPRTPELASGVVDGPVFRYQEVGNDPLPIAKSDPVMVARLERALQRLEVLERQERARSFAPYATYMRSVDGNASGSADEVGYAYCDTSSHRTEGQRSSALVAAPPIASPRDSMRV